MNTEKPSPMHTENSENPQNLAKPGESEPAEFNGFKTKNLPEPTRYGDWEVGGRCSDF